MIILSKQRIFMKNGGLSMNIFKQVKIEAINILYTATLDNGVKIYVFGDYAIGSNGKKYYHVGREDGDILTTVGWSCDIDRAIILNEKGC